MGRWSLPETAQTWRTLGRTRKPREKEKTMLSLTAFVVLTVGLVAFFEKYGERMGTRY